MTAGLRGLALFATFVAVPGTGTFTGNTIQNLLPGQVATQNEPPSTFWIN